ncbi:hypothetical protein QQF64_011356 [Cirrhinus molitorella]|uniref:Uncharacterized protein n=1 Tax=Cirrhinus molitorella TaxID=172907 RepID=A0ABR3LYZ7_9TELE
MSSQRAHSPGTIKQRGSWRCRTRDAPKHSLGLCSSSVLNPMSTTVTSKRPLLKAVEVQNDSVSRFLNPFPYDIIERSSSEASTVSEGCAPVQIQQRVFWSSRRKACSSGCPDVALNPTMLVHIAVFLFLMGNALGNYTMTIWYPSESANETVIPVCSPDCPDRIDAHYLLNGRHFCKVLEYSISFENPLTFLTLLPLSTGYFFLGLISGLQFFLVIMLYVWLGIGLVSVGFCCQQLLLVARGQTWCELQKGQLSESRGTWRANLTDVFGSRWALGLFLPVQTVETVPGNWQVYHDHKHD